MKKDFFLCSLAGQSKGDLVYFINFIFAITSKNFYNSKPLFYILAITSTGKYIINFSFANQNLALAKTCNLTCKRLHIPKVVLSFALRVQAYAIQIVDLYVFLSFAKQNLEKHTSTNLLTCPYKSEICMGMRSFVLPIRTNRRFVRKFGRSFVNKITVCIRLSLCRFVPVNPEFVTSRAPL